MKRHILFIAILSASFVYSSSLAASIPYGEYIRAFKGWNGVPVNGHINILDDQNADVNLWDNSQATPVGQNCGWTKLTYKVDENNKITFFNGSNTAASGTYNSNTITIQLSYPSVIYPNNAACGQYLSGGSNSLYNGIYSLK